jgi:hypothetical protein
MVYAGQGRQSTYRLVLLSFEELFIDTLFQHFYIFISFILSFPTSCPSPLQIIVSLNLFFQNLYSRPSTLFMYFTYLLTFTTWMFARNRYIFRSNLYSS